MKKTYTAGQRREIVAEFEASGLGAMAYCRQRGISAGSLAAWRKRQAMSGEPSRAAAAARWLPVEITPDRRTPSTGNYIVRFGGAELELPEDFAVEQARVLIGLVVAATREGGPTKC